MKSSKIRIGSIVKIKYGAYVPLLAKPFGMVVESIGSGEYGVQLVNHSGTVDYGLEEIDIIYNLPK